LCWCIPGRIRWARRRTTQESLWK